MQPPSHVGQKLSAVLLASSLLLATLPASSHAANLAANLAVSPATSAGASPGVAASATAPPVDCSRLPAVTLDWAVARQRLLACNRTIALARRSVAAAEADIRIAGQRINPTLALGSESISPSAGIGAGGPLDKQIDYTARIDQTFERGGKRGYRIEAAEQAWRAATWTAADTVRQTELALAQAWIALWGAQQRLELHHDLASLYDRTLDGARRRLKAGDMSRADLARIELEYQHAASEQAVAEAQRTEARNVLASLLAMEARAVAIEVEDPWPTSTAEGIASSAALAGPAGDNTGDTSDTSDQRPDLLAARAQLAAANARSALARSLQTPDVTVGVQTERYARPAGNGWSFGVFASVPLFVHHNSEGEIARAEAERGEAELTATSIRQQALADRQRLLDVLSRARDRRARLEGSALPLAQRVAADAELGFRKGAGTVLDLLDALRQLRALQLDSLDARLDEDRADAEVRAGMLLPGSARDPVFGNAVDRLPGR